ncbi:MAG: phosphoenolpyruvate carboxykinase (ATP) [Anaerolineaceae bacterium 4572_78]|nr:MAG: phosphoenolpyruvate carboxykinase (ATP) [Anaerolineaceae bacterium 4572_78]
MKEYGKRYSSVGLDTHGLTNLNNVYWNLSPAPLYEEALKRGDGELVDRGPLLVITAPFTGRSPKDKFMVEEASSKDNIWWNDENRPISQERFDELHRRVTAYLQNRDLFVQDTFVGADPEYRVPVRIIAERASNSLFAWNMFMRPKLEDRVDHHPEFTLICVPDMDGIKEFDGLNSDAFALIDFAKKLVLVGKTAYCGEIKKSIFTVMNYILTDKNVMPMHCSANYGPNGDTAIFFGLSGTGKTTLSAVSSRTLIGDDEHGWSDNGIFNFEGGCYAKVIKLSKEAEPEIYATTQMFGTLLENVIVDPDTHKIDLDDGTITQNTRASYPIHYIPNASENGLGKGHPKNIVFLTADAFGVMPPISKLTPAQAMYHFISGYTAKVAGTERGITEPQATFSACFGSPFMPRHPGVYAKLLGKKIAEHDVDCWLVNTGWTGGAYGVGNRMAIKYTRAMVNAALNGELKDVEYTEDPIFGVSIPTSCPNVPPEVLIPKNTWEDKEAYDEYAKKLAGMFIENFHKFEDGVSVTEEIKEAGPKL